jgi:hypothetical protein
VRTVVASTVAGLPSSSQANAVTGFPAASREAPPSRTTEAPLHISAVPSANVA